MMSDDMALPLSTRRLSLRRFTSGDYAAYCAYHSLPSVYRYLYSRPPAGEAMRKRFEKATASRFTENGDTFCLAVTRQEDDTVIGEVLLKLASREALQAEVGYILDPAFAGNGYATEAIRAMVGLGFGTLGFHRIFARLDTENIGSIGVVERLGFRREAHLIENDRFDGVWGSEYVYATLKREWLARSAYSAERSLSKPKRR